MPTPTIKLSSGYDMPMLGLGTWQSAPGQVAKAVEMAVKAGYRLIDCAYLYENQVEIGEALKKLFATGVKREDLFITSKVWNTFHSAAGCKKNVDEILKELQLNYVDLMLIHWPHGYQEGDGLFPKVKSFQQRHAKSSGACAHGKSGDGSPSALLRRRSTSGLSEACECDNDLRETGAALL
ncbi:hypothetical protein Y032_0091g2473 [Ancylostoma ceylanicum]|uniref:NADP-dependent oxidoreductase domain-containing protein n=1 Tax=Ancylostoma ceylanicum TaxID=53326 RepID=A0A016TLJ5_9BILA|nr:hypothetical protein Y032_0091g2473 [Ancylostoma ceylanicum]